MATAEELDNPRVFFDISIAGEDAGRVVMTLFADVVPKTAENFRQGFLVVRCTALNRRIQQWMLLQLLGSPLPLRRCLCTGESGVGRSGKPLHYKGSIFHRIIPDFM